MVGVVQMSEIDDLKVGDKLKLQEFRASRLAHVIALHGNRVGIKWFESDRWRYDWISKYTLHLYNDNDNLEIVK